MVREMSKQGYLPKSPFGQLDLVKDSGDHLNCNSLSRNIVRSRAMDTGEQGGGEPQAETYLHYNPVGTGPHFAHQLPPLLDMEDLAE